MKKFILSLVALVSFMVFPFGHTLNAQSLSDDIASATSNLTACSTELNALQGKIDQLKTEAFKSFADQQSKLDTRKTALTQQRAKWEEGNSKEANMMFDMWPERVAAKKDLIKAEQALSRDQFVLILRKADFEHRIAQIEKNIQSVFAQEIAARANMFNGNMQRYAKKLNDVTF